MTSVASDTAGELLFSWDSSRRQITTLAIFVVLSLLAHALCFYLFQIVYPTPLALLPPPGRVTFIAPNSEGGRTLLRWIEGEDPAVAFTTQPPPEARLRALPKTEHLPSYSTIQPILKELPPFKMNLGIPSSRPPGAVRWSFPRTAAVTVSAGTYISFSKEFDQFGAPMLPRLAFTRSTEETPETLQFRVAVNHLGEIRYCFPVNSSGDPALDEQARLKVIRSRFSQRPVKGGDQLLVWGTAVVHWGSDIARPQQTPSGTLTP